MLRAQGQVLGLENNTSSVLLPNRSFVPEGITQPETPLQLNTSLHSSFGSF